jgi:hypothetical protein
MTCLALLLILILGTGCASKSVFRFSKKDIAKVYINPKYCSVLQDGELDCSHVRVQVGTVQAESLKQ